MGKAIAKKISLKSVGAKCDYYRGYCYDNGTGFYYLQTRYYDPSICRFINPDTIDYLDPENINGLNLYAYCMNNPVMNVDPSGHSIITAFLITIGISAAIAAVDGGITAAMSGQDFWKGFAAGAIGGALGGAINYFLPGAGSLLGRAVSTMTYNITNEIFQTGKFDVNNLGLYFADTIMDVGLSMLYLGNLTTNFLGVAMGGLIDAGIDIIQTNLYFSPQAQQKNREETNASKKRVVQFDKLKLLYI